MRLVSIAKEPNQKDNVVIVNGIMNDNDWIYPVGKVLFCFVLLLTFVTLSALQGTHIDNRSHYIIDHSSQSNIHQFATVPVQYNNTLYLMSYEGRRKQIGMLILHKVGFNASIDNAMCSFREKKQLFDPHTTYRRVLCYKYPIINNVSDQDVKLIYPSRRFRIQALDRIWMDKTALHEILSVYCNQYHSNDNVCDFHILSYHLGVPNERIEFLTKHIDCNNHQPQYDKVWVFKEAAHQGIGVHIINNHQEIYRIITANVSETINNCSFNPIQNETYFSEEHKFVNYHKIDEGYVVDRKQCLIQKFVANPLLVKMSPEDSVKHVFHLRSYLWIASYSNPMIVLHWPRPILMINPNEYANREEKLNKEVIVTNRHQMDEHKIIDDSYQWIWGRTQLQKYLDEEYGTDLLGGKYTMNKLNEDIKHIAKHVFMANMYNNKLQKHKIFEKRNEFHFDILCMDLLITDTFELKLMEVNSYCLEFCHKSKVEKKIIDGGYDWDCDSYYNEAIGITLEIMNKKLLNHTVENIDSMNNYEVAFWE